MAILSSGILHMIQDFLLPRSIGNGDVSEDKHAGTLGAQESGSTRTIENSPLPKTIPPLLAASQPLIDVALPRVRLDHQPALASQGWTTITYNEPVDKLEISAAALLHTSKAFFNQPESYKLNFKAKLGSEEGWSCVEGEKEFVILRTLDGTPPELGYAATAFWTEAGSLLNQQMGRIAESLGLPAEKLTIFSAPCKELGPGKTSTLLRLFKYEGAEGCESRTVAEAHKDLGLLSLVIGDSPGLEVWNLNYKQWFPIECSYTRPAGTLLVGRQLELFSNNTYRAGGHRVRSYSDPVASALNYSARSLVTNSEQPQTSRRKCRYSIVFVLRAHACVPVNTGELTTSVTGQFSSPIKDITAGDLFMEIQKAHFNVNAQFGEREKQKRDLAKGKV